MVISSFPLTAFAGFFDFVSELFAEEVEVEQQHNVQNMPILESVANTNPNPLSNTPDLIIEDESVLEASVGPLGTPLEIEEQNMPDTVIVYVVRQGDTVASLAKMFNVSPNTIIWANGKKVLSVGEEITILPVSGLKYVIKSGDTIAGIAKKFKSDAEEIVRFNGLGEKLTVGTEIIIPDGELTPTTSGGQAIVKSSGSVGFVGYFIRPATGRITQGPHGPRRTAVDIANKYGTPIYAAASGTVGSAKIGGYNGGLGNFVVINHPNGLQTLYAHLASVTVVTGQTVSQGDQIGTMGTSGKSTGNHLHFVVNNGPYGVVPFLK